MTALWTADALVAATGGRMALPFAATGVSIDTRTLRPGDLFVALVGENSDGHAHVAAALAAGAAGAMVHRDLPGPMLRVDDTLAGLHALGAAGRARFAGRVIAVTGSVGKTTTKEMLRRALAPLGAVHAAEASYNNHWGVPLTLARLPADAAVCVAEIGMNHAGEIAPLSRLVAPHVAVVTLVAAAHIGHLGSLAAIADEKASVSAGLLPGGTLLLPQAGERLDRLRAGAGSARVLLFGDADGADCRLLQAGDVSGMQHVRARVAGREVAFALAAPGRHMALNACAALLAATEAGVTPADAAAALDGFAPYAGRGAQRLLPRGALLLDESYNASSVAVRAALSVLATMPGRRIAVLGDMLELGAHAEAEHAALVAPLTQAADLVMTCGPLMRAVSDGVPAALRGAHAADSTALAPLVADLVRPGDSVLVKGSLGSRMRVVVQALEGSV